MTRKRRPNARRVIPLLRGGIAKNITGIFIRLLPLFILLAAAGLAAKLAVSFVVESGYFKVKNVRIIGEKAQRNLSLSISQNIGSGANIFDTDIKNQETALGRKYPELKEIKVKRVMPDTLEVSYKLRKPFCQADSGEFYMVSDDATVLPTPVPVAEPGLIIITGIEIYEGKAYPARRQKALERAVSLIRDIYDSGFSQKERIARIDMRDPANPAIFLEDETRIEMGEYSFKEKKRLLEEVLGDMKAKNRYAKVIDLRFKDVVVIPR